MAVLLGTLIGCSSTVVDAPRDAGRSPPAGGGATGAAGSPSGGKSGAGGPSGTAGGGASGGGGAASTTDASTCPSTCGPNNFNGGTCCDGKCVEVDNDPYNCGACGTVCPADAPVCFHTQCVAPQCGDPTEDAGSSFRDGGPACRPSELCCGNFCCKANEICCTVHSGGWSNGLELGCYDPSQSNGTCPRGCPMCVCASPDTPIATPSGDRPIATLNVGDLVYSVDHGAMTTVPIVRVNRAPVQNHSVVRIALVTGAVLEISPRHPTADGRTFGGLHAGDTLDGVRITAATLVPYTHDATYDILPASDTGAYFAGGVLVGSTLAESSTLVVGPTLPASMVSAER